MEKSMSERRRSPRRKPLRTQPPVKLQIDGSPQELAGQVSDANDSGLSIEIDVPVKLGTPVRVTGDLLIGLSRANLKARPATVVFCKKRPDGRHAVGISFTQPFQHPQNDSSVPDHYDALQLSPKADPDTIHRVYRLLAQRFHPDNLETGDTSQFKLVLDAYTVLSDPEKRAAYDATLTHTRQLRWRIFDQSTSTQGKEGEKRKRAGILSLLYAQRINQPQQPNMTIHEFEDLLGCPREHLEFSLWYLKETGCVSRNDNGRYFITVQGVDQAEKDDVVTLPRNRLLKPAS
jgi:curved DNA-binding protein